MSWIRLIEPSEAPESIRRTYIRVSKNERAVDNIPKAHSLRPHTLEGHLALHRSVLHHDANRLPMWLRESLGVYVSILNGCQYCIEHHSRGLKRALDDDDRADAILQALASSEYGLAFSPRERTLLEYARLLTMEPSGIRESTIVKLRNAGWDDGEILEANQIISYFAYANRTALRLGVQLQLECAEPPLIIRGWMHHGHRCQTLHCPS